jgi:hypothetical protein
MFLSDWTLAALRFAGILGPSVEMQEERARQTGAVLRYVDSKRGGQPELADDFIAPRSTEDEAKERLSKLVKPSRETLLKQLKDEAYTQGRNEELSRLKQKLDFALQANAERVKAKVRQEVIEHSVKICDLCVAAGESRMMATWVRQGLELQQVATNLHREISESREIHEPVRAGKVASLTEAEVRLGLREQSWGELRVC